MAVTATRYPLITLDEQGLKLAPKLVFHACQVARDIIQMSTLAWRTRMQFHLFPTLTPTSHTATIHLPARITTLTAVLYHMS